MNRLVNVERIKAVTARFRKLTRLRRSEDSDVVAQAADVQKVEARRPEEDQKLRPLGRVAAKRPQVAVFRMRSRTGRGTKKKRRWNNASIHSGSTAAVTTAPLEPGCSPSAVEVARNHGRHQEEQPLHGR